MAEYPLGWRSQGATDPCGWAVYFVSYLALAHAAEAWQAWALFLVYGAFHGLSEPAEKALVKDLAPIEQRGRSFGYYNFM